MSAYETTWACDSVAMPPGSPSLDSELQEGDRKTNPHGPHCEAQDLSQVRGEWAQERFVGCMNKQSLD